MSPPPTHSHPYFSALSAFSPICFIVQIFSLLICSFKFDLCKHEYLKSFCLIINSACHNYICIQVLLLSTHRLWKNNLFKVKISMFYYGRGGYDEHKSRHILYTRHIVTTSSTELYSLMKIFLTVFKIEGIIALTIKGR